MRLKKWNEDSFAAGLILGIISIPGFFALFYYIRKLVISTSGNDAFMRPPVVQLITLLINVLIFRYIMVNLKREYTGKGLLFITVLSTLVYFFIFYRFSR
jgi:hypothetical protein